MKKTIALITLVAWMAACNTKKSWTAEDRSEYVSNCINGAKGVMDEGKLRGYCECMQAKVEAKYPSADEAEKHPEFANSAEGFAIAKECSK